MIWVVLVLFRVQAAVAGDGTRAVEWGPRSQWREAEDVHVRWGAAGRPNRYHLDFAGQHVRVVGGQYLSWELPMA
ncbi:hypothetical protein AB0442_42375 [Kitasatospora sp. NPDC085895]|uniref:hypothetical protein n=1 Tax=Kitasatospora sp. NPDC085895 TaxID=3155057 RepID=UPI00344E52C2